MKKFGKGFGFLPLLFVITGVLVLGGTGYWYYQTQTETPELIGGDKDAGGCLIGAGYPWCEVKQKCLRVWEEPCEATSTRQASNSQTADWKTYTNSQYGFEIKYPANLTFQESAYGENFNVGFLKPDQKMAYYFFVGENPANGRTVESFISDEIISKGYVNVGNLKFFKVYAYGDGDHTWYLIQRDNSIFYIGNWGDSSNDPIIQEILSTFRFTN